jgi:hypothetical protein
MIATINSELKGADAETLGLLLEVLRKPKQGFAKPMQTLPHAMPHFCQSENRFATAAEIYR